MFNVLKCTGENEEFRVVCTCEHLDDARAIEFSLNYAIKQAGDTKMHFAILDTEQYAIVHRTKPLLSS